MENHTVEIHQAANGFCCVSTFSFWRSVWLGLLLMCRYGFWRKGRWVPGVADEAVYPDFVRGERVIHAGWDHWLGYDFLAGNEKSDIFLRAFYERHCKQRR